MKLGDKIELPGVKWTVRAFTAAEHERFDTLAAEVGLTAHAARVEALRAARHGTARQKLLEAEQRRIQAKLDKYLDKRGDLKHGLTEEKRLEAFTLAAELDEVQAQIETLRLEPIEDLLTADDAYLQAREAVTVRFMHELLKVEHPLLEWHAALTDQDVVTLDEVVAVGKLRAGLSARDRRHRAQMTQVLGLTALNARGAASESQQQQPSQEEPAVKPGTPGRSKSSSRRSKDGNSAPSKQPNPQ